MNAPFNKLTPAEAERLALVAEECAEIIQIVGKILRHGYESSNPDAPDKGNNREMLAREIGDLDAVVDLMIVTDDLSQGELIDAKAEKSARMRRYLHHNCPVR